MSKRMVVIGGDAAGMSAASKAKRVAPDTEVVVLERGGVVSYAACGIPYYVGGSIPDADDLLARSPDAFAKAGIDLRLHTEVTAIDPEARTVTARGPQGEETLSYDDVLIATGATAIRPPIDGLDNDGVFTVRHFDDGVALREFVDGRQPRHATIVGAGYIGLEFAEVLRERGIEVTVVEMADRVFPSLDADMSAHVAAELERHGVAIRTSEKVTRLEPGDDGVVQRAVTTDEAWDTDLVVVGGGARPASALGEAAGVELHASGAIVTDERQATNVAGVWAAGDVATARHLVTGEPAYVPLGQTANKQGRVAGENIVGGDARFAGIVGTSVAKVFEAAVARTGLTAVEAAAEGLDYAEASITAHDRAHYYPGAGKVTVKLVGERGTRRLLGAQLVGPGAEKRVDVLATALHAGLDVDTVAELDLAYAPPYAPVWDPVLVAAGQLAKALD